MFFVNVSMFLCRMFVNVSMFCECCIVAPPFWLQVRPTSWPTACRGARPRQDYNALAFLMSSIAISVSSRLLVVMSSTCAERSMEKIVAVSNATTTMLEKAFPHVVEQLVARTADMLHQRRMAGGEPIKHPGLFPRDQAVDVTTLRQRLVSLQ